jgi:DNA-binding response OmpR family regulator
LLRTGSLEAGDGRRGLELAISEMPDCVITDMMMPDMSGTEMCKKIKDNEKTCHIPVIILTAKTAIEQRVEGLEVGADSYIPKPFNIDHLKVRIRKLIELRRTIREKYEGKHETRKETIPIKSESEKFLEKLEEIVNRQMHDSELSVETVSRQLGISRSQLQRRLKQLTNQNPSDYLCTAHLQYAALLLTNKSLSISDVTYATGFTSLSHFSSSFKEFFGMSPSHYVEISKGNMPVVSEE